VASDWVAVVGTLAGAGVGGGVSYLTTSHLEKRRRKWEDRHRWTQERRALYVRYLRMIDHWVDVHIRIRVVQREVTRQEARLAARGGVEDAAVKEIRHQFDALNELHDTTRAEMLEMQHDIELLASGQVIEAASRLFAKFPVPNESAPEGATVESLLAEYRALPERLELRRLLQDDLGLAAR
jgi:hypothetical protein